MTDTRKLTRGVAHLTIAGCLLLTLTFTTGAYTIVMKGGRRVEIPDRFSITKTTRTYEVGPNIQITQQTARRFVVGAFSSTNIDCGQAIDYFN